MKLLIVLAATAAAAAVAAALSIPAGANRSQPKPAAPTELVSCLRAHGLNPPDDIFQLKPWMLRQAGTDAGKAAMSACGVDFGPPKSETTGKDLAACLRSHGADVPAGADGLALKTWIGDHSGDAKVMSALEQCDAGAEKAPPGAKGCGGGGAATPAQKPSGAATPTL
jgi:hypothetical protein